MSVLLLIVLGWLAIDAIVIAGLILGSKVTRWLDEADDPIERELQDIVDRYRAGAR